MRVLVRQWLKLGVLVWPCVAAAPAMAASGPTVKTDQSCYVVGNSVALYGSGFAARRAYDVTDDGVDFGRAKTNADGGFATHFAPGGLAAGVAQGIHRIDVTDGTSEATTSFTVTRQTGARFEASSGDPRRLRAPFQAWGLAMDGRPRAVYLHYVSPAGRARTTVWLGRTSGQCGYLETRSLRFFPFTPSAGRWTLQVDTARAYAQQPSGPVARIGVIIRRTA